VVGLPLYPDGAEHELTRAARNFAAELEARYGLPVFMHDERYSSAVAEDEMRGPKHAGNRNVAKSCSHLDALAAQIILQGFFDERATA
jgi:putative Holliday junction resolvase